MKPTQQDPLGNSIKCLCGEENCKVGMRIISMPENKVKLQIINAKDIDSVVVDKTKLKEMLK